MTNKSMRRNQISILNRLCSNSLRHQHHHHHHPAIRSSINFSTTSTTIASPPSTSSIMSEDKKTFLSENGYLWIKNFVPQTVARNIQKRINHLLDTFDPNSTKSIFKTHRTEEQHKDSYFLESGACSVITLCVNLIRICSQVYAFAFLILLLLLQL